METLIIIGIIIMIVFCVIGIAVIYFLKLQSKELNRLFSDIEDIKQFLVID